MSDNDNQSVQESAELENEESWIMWYCSLSGNQLFCQVDRAFIKDSFNLFGLKNSIGKDFSRVIEVILRPNDSDSESGEMIYSASLLYGLIHARYIITSPGLDAMRKKYLEKDFGECPRVYCRGQAVLPVGMSDETRHSAVKFFCSQCGEVYNANHIFRHIDGAYFGTTFPHLFFMTYADLRPTIPIEKYIPKIFGFKIHRSRIDSNESDLATRSIHRTEDKPSAMEVEQIDHQNLIQSTSTSTLDTEESGPMPGDKAESRQAEQEQIQTRPQQTVRFADEVMIGRDHQQYDSKIVDTDSVSRSGRQAKRAKH